MKNTLSLSVAVLALCCVSLGCLFNTSQTTVNGVVVTSGGKPIEGAEVTFGGPLSPAKTVTGPDGKFTLTVKHRPTQMLRVNATKKGYGQMEKVEFPGFWAPKEEVKVEMIAILGY